VGEAEYEGELGEFVPYLRAGKSGAADGLGEGGVSHW
jgi:hypothetical protein